MTASLHIRGTGSSVIDSVFVCRHRGEDGKPLRAGPATLERWLARDRDALAGGGVRATPGDLRCLALGHLARVAVRALEAGWTSEAPARTRLEAALKSLRGLDRRCRATPSA